MAMTSSPSLAERRIGGNLLPSLLFVLLPLASAALAGVSAGFGDGDGFNPNKYYAREASVKIPAQEEPDAYSRTNDFNAKKYHYDEPSARNDPYSRQQQPYSEYGRPNDDYYRPAADASHQAAARPFPSDRNQYDAAGYGRNPAENQWTSGERDRGYNEYAQPPPPPTNVGNYPTRPGRFGPDVYQPSHAIGYDEQPKTNKLAVAANHLGKEAGSVVAQVSKMLGKTMKTVYRSAKKSAAGVVREAPAYVDKAADFIQATLRMDPRGRVLSLLKGVDEDLRAARKAFAGFLQSWGPMMDKLIEYIGPDNLKNQKLKFKDMEQLDKQLEGMRVLALGYELMRMMMIWRENVLAAHEAFKSYLLGVEADLKDPSGIGMRDEDVDREFVYKARAIHNYLQLISWLDIDELTLEQRMKIDYLSATAATSDGRATLFEHMTLYFDDLYNTMVEEFEDERVQVTGALKRATDVIQAATDDFTHIDAFFNHFRAQLAETGIEGVNWEAPEALVAFMAELKPQLERNSMVYDNRFVDNLVAAKNRFSAET